MKFKRWYNKFGVRKVGDTTKVPVLKTDRLVLPTDTVSHLVGFNKVGLGLKLHDRIIENNISNGIYLLDVFQLHSLLGNPKFKASKAKNLVAQHYRSLEGVHRLTTKASAIGLANPILVNYQPINLAYTYKKREISKIYRWGNIFKTMIDNINQDDTDREYIILLNGAPEPHEDTWYDRVAKLDSRKILAELNDPYTYFSVELHKWMIKRDNIFSTVNEDKLARINFVWSYGGNTIPISFRFLLALLGEETDDMGTLGVTAGKISNSKVADIVPNIVQSLHKFKIVDILPSINMDSIAEEEDPYADEHTADQVTELLSKAKIEPVEDGEDDTHKRSKDKLMELAEREDLTTSKFRTMKKKIDNYQELPSPYDPSKKLVDSIQITPADTKLDKDKQIVPSHLGIPDKTMLSSTLIAYDKTYVRKLHKPMVLRTIDSLNRGGVIPTDYQVKKVGSILGEHEVHTLKLYPLDGQPSTVRFKLPVVSDDGTYKSNGTTYRLKKQRLDLPIRKIGPTSVSLGSDYGKVFIDRSTLVVNDESVYLRKQLVAEVQADSSKTTVVYGTPFDHNVKTPMVYSKLGKNFLSIKKGGVKLHLDYHTRDTILSNKSDLKKIEKHGLLIGSMRQGYLVVDFSNNIHKVHQGKAELIGDIYTVLGLPPAPPMDLVEMRVLGRRINMAIVLGWYYGLSTLIHRLGAKVEVYPSNKRTTGMGIMQLTFSNVKVIVLEASVEARMVLRGLSKDKGLKDIAYEDIDKPKAEGFSILLEDTERTVHRYLTELDMLDDYFIDPLTKDVLESIKEPTTFRGLLFRALELLTTDEHPKTTEGSVIRTRGYERLNSFVYKELVSSIRDFKNRPDGRRKVIEVGPYAVWNSMTQDSSQKPVEEANPIGSLKQAEITTYSGQGGRATETMTAPSRMYSASDTGILSEGSPDSGDTGINNFLSANPRLGNIYGINDSDIQDTNDNPTSSYSTSFLLTPGAAKDTPSRANFVNIQNGHLVSTKGATAPIVRSGYEYVLAYRGNDLYAKMADEDGVVLSVDTEGIIVRYKSGEEVGVQLGNRHGSSEGAYYPHLIITDLKPKAKFKQGDAIAYNSGFFEQDYLVPGKLIFKAGFTIKTALVEGMHTVDDSCAISKRVAEMGSTQTTKTESYTVKFTDNIHALVKLGTKVNVGDPLFYIEDEITVGSGTFDDSAVDTLKELARQSPKAKYKGTIDRIEVRYHGEISDMSDGLATATRASNRRLIKEAKASKRTPYTGEVDNEYRVAGNPLLLDTLEIKVYILREHTTGTGDKFIFGAQLKATVSAVVPGMMYTEDGEEVDALFSDEAEVARMVHTFKDNGAYATVLRASGRWLAEQYKP